MSEKEVTVFKIEDSEISDIIKKANVKSKVEEEKIKRALKDISSLTAYEEELKKIKIPPATNKVIYTDGNTQLVYENGEFFEVSTTDSTKTRRKKTRKEATTMYVEYFIQYRLNPIIESREKYGMTRTPAKTKSVDEVKAKIKPNERVKKSPVVSKSKKVEERDR